MKASIVITVFNEEKNINLLLRALFNQSQKPDEIIIVDGGSRDKTVETINKFIQGNKKKRIKVKILIKKGNRSVGRNEAIRVARNKLIAITDAGCVPEKNWFKNIISPFSSRKVDVVAGYYKARPKNIFEKCVIPYVFVMPDRIDPQNFLPATRSMAIRKITWKKVGGFDEKLSNNEDYVFARKLKDKKFNIKFEKNAIVYWIPRSSINQSFTMFYRFAKGDAEAKIYRPKVVFIFARYAVGLILLLSFLKTFSVAIIFALLFLMFAYVFWSIKKNYKYVKNIQAFIFLPLLQLTSDLAVLFGTGLVLFERFFPAFSILAFLWSSFLGINLPYVGQNAYNFITYSLITHNYNKFGLFAAKFAPIITVSENIPKNPEYFIHHPPLLSIYMMPFLNIFGLDFWVGRFSMILFMLGTLFVTYLIGRTIVNKKYGLVSLGMMAIIPATSIFGKMIGQENLVILFCLLCTYFSFLYLKKREIKYFYLSIFSICLATFSDWPATYFSLFLLPIFAKYKKLKVGLILPIFAGLSAVISILWIAYIRVGFWDLTKAIGSRSFLELQDIANWPILWVGVTALRTLIYFNPLIVLLALAVLVQLFKQVKSKKLDDRQLLTLIFFFFGVFHITLYTEASFTHPYLLIYFLPFFSFASSWFIYQISLNKKYLFFASIVIMSFLYLGVITILKNSQIESNVWRYQLANVAKKYLTDYETIVYNKYYAIDPDIWKYPLLIDAVQTDEKDSESFLRKYKHYVYSCEPTCNMYPAEIESLKKRYSFIKIVSEKADVYIFDLQNKQKNNQRIRVPLKIVDNKILSEYRKIRDTFKVPQI